MIDGNSVKTSLKQFLGLITCQTGPKGVKREVTPWTSSSVQQSLLTQIN